MLLIIIVLIAILLLAINWLGGVPATAEAIAACLLSFADGWRYMQFRRRSWPTQIRKTARTGEFPV